MEKGEISVFNITLARLIKAKVFCIRNNYRLIKTLNMEEYNQLFSKVDQSIQLFDLFSLSEIQNLQDMFSGATGMASIITKPDGTPLTQPSNFCRLCKEFVRQTPIGRTNCFKSDAVIGKYQSTGPRVQKCLSVGLSDAGASITVGGVHIGNWLIGQVRTEVLDEKRILDYADEIGANSEEMLSAAREVPYMDEVQFSNIAQLLFEFANQLSEKAHSNLLLRKQIELSEQSLKLLENEKEKYKLLAENSSDVIWTMDMEGKYHYVSPSVYRLRGYTPEENLRQSFDETLTPQSAAYISGLFSDTVKRIMSGERPEPEMLELEQRCKDGSTVWTEINISGIYNDENQFMYFLGVTRDISERKKHKNILKKYKQIVSSTPDGISLLDKQYRYLIVNQAYERFAGISREKIIGKTIAEYLGEDLFLSNIKENFDRCLQGETIKYQMWADYVVLGRRYVDVTYFPYTENNLDVIGVVALTKDITELQLTKEHLMASENRKADILRALPDLLFLFNQDGDYLEVFSEDDSKLIVPREELVGKNIRDILPDEFTEKAMNAFRYAIEKETLVQFTYSMEIDKQTAYYEARVVPNKDNNLMAIVRDVTQQRMAERHRDLQLRYTKALNEIAEAIIASDNTNEIFCHTNRIIGNSLNIDRFALYHVLPNENKMNVLCHNELNEDMVFSTKSLPNFVKALPQSFAFMQQKNKYIISHSDDVNKYILKDRAQDLLHEQLKVKSLLWYPFAFDKNGYYLFFLNQLSQRRNWLDIEIGFLESVAKQVAMALIKNRLLEERNQAEKTIRSNEITFRTVADHTYDWEYWLGSNDRLIYISPSCERITGYSRQEFTLNPTLLKTIIHPEDREAHEMLCKEVSDNKLLNLVGEIDLKIITKQGDIKYIGHICRPVFDEDNQYAGIRVSNRDITLRKAAENRLKLLNRAVEQSTATVVITDKEGHIQYVNPRFTQLTGYTFDEIKGKNPRFLQSGNHTKSYYNELWKTILSGNNWHGEFHNIKKNNEPYWEQAVISPILDEKGEIAHFIAVKEDITEKKKMLEDLIEAKERAEESDRLKTAFLNNVSHEIRTPFNGILGFLSLMTKKGVSDLERDQYMGIINKSADRLLNTINDIVESSQIQTGQTSVKMTDISFSQIINEISNRYEVEASKKGLSFQIINKLPDHSTTLVADRSKLLSILNKLIDNAVKFTESGSVKLEIDQLENDYSFSIHDTGIGIPQEKLHTIFNYFTQVELSETKAFEGSGLGLFISKAYVDMLGGNIWVQSCKNKGTTFAFTLPIVS